MRKYTRSPWLDSVREFLFSQLRAKITLPYLILAIVLAIVVTYLATQILARDLEERFARRLVDAGGLVADTMVQIEREHLATLRAIAHTEGMPQAVRDRKTDAIRSIVQPLAINNRADLVEVLDLTGAPQFSMHHRPDSTRPDDYDYAAFTDYRAWALVMRVVNGETDQAGDKFVDLVRAPWGYALYSAGPIKVGDQLVGVVLVGTYLDGVVRRLDSVSLARVTVYDQNGQVLSTTLTTREPDRARLSKQEYADVQQKLKSGVFTRPTLAGYGTRPYDEAFGNLTVRQKESLGLFSVALARDEFVTASSDEIRNRMITIFSLGIVLVMFIGVLLAGSIVKPVSTLAHASERVAEGDLNAHVEVRTRDEIGTLARAFNRMVEGLRERELIKDLFGRVVSKEVGEQLIETSAHGGVKLGGEVREVTMLFTDIRDFTALSERYPPTEVVSFLNEYFTEMLDVIDQHRGMVNKFGGDSTLVIFGAPIAQPDHAHRAVMCALALRRQLLAFNQRRRAQGFEPIRIGIGINTGNVVAGQIGSPGRFEYTVIGDAVNVTSRIQDLTKQFPEYDLLISEATQHALGDDSLIECKDLGALQIRGKQELVRIYAVLDEKRPHVAIPKSVLGELQA